jgi:hypothetical protein
MLFFFSLLAIPVNDVSATRCECVSVCMYITGIFVIVVSLQCVVYSFPKAERERKKTPMCATSSVGFGLV